jgi:hypothetical protein
VRRPVALSQRSLRELLLAAARARACGDVIVRERGGIRHRVTLRDGRVVAVRAAGRFDPILELLRRHGTLNERAWAQSIEQLARSERRAGQLAIETAGVTDDALRSALADQARERLGRILARADTHGLDAWLVPRDVAPSEQAVSLCACDLLRELVGVRANPRSPLPGVHANPRPLLEGRDKRRLRRLALALHPDRNTHLSPEARARLAAQLAEATAAYHGLG